MKRRIFLCNIGLGLAATTMRVEASADGSFFAKKHLPIGIQLYTLGEAVQKDLRGTLDALSGIGYRTVELAGFMGHSARALRAALDQAGLSCRSEHVPIQPRVAGEPSLSGDLGKLAEDAHAIGIEYVVAPTFAFPAHDAALRPGEGFLAFFIRAGQSMTEEDWHASARLLNSAGERLRPLGLKLAYHNHNFEFAPLSAGCGFDILLRETDPALVSFEMDVGWVASAGRNPVDLLREHPGRFRLMHVKDIKASTRPNTALQQDPTEVGAGVIPWQRILPLAFQAGIRDFYIEQEPPFPGPRLDSVRKSFEYLSRLSV